MNTAPTALARFFDDTVAVGQSYCYRVDGGRCLWQRGDLRTERLRHSGR